MRYMPILLVLLAMTRTQNSHAQRKNTMTPTPLRLWYREAAEKWTDALPIGNGHLGAMVYGNPAREHLALNESTLWSGEPRDETNPKALEVLPKVRAALFAGHYEEAAKLSREMQGPYSAAYMPMGDLTLDFNDKAPFENYERDLDLTRAVATVRYKQGGATFTREMFVSFPDKALVLRLTCDQPGKISFSAALDSKLHHETFTPHSETLALRGKAPESAAPNYLNVKNPIVYDADAKGAGMTFETQMKITAQSGKFVTDANRIRVENADSATLILTAATSFNGYDRSPSRDGKNPAELAAKALAAASSHDYAHLLNNHVKDYQHLFSRVTLDLGPALTADLPTPERIEKFHESNDPQMAALLFQYGRYLMISGSRAGGPPLNLQGIWNDELRPPWSSNYTININTEMNYWPSETTNLAECHAPLLDWLHGLAANGKKIATVNYGASGWVAHHNSDIWGKAAPVGEGSGSPEWANWEMGGAWLCQDLWEHYAFSGDAKFLHDRAYPLMRGAAEFCLNWLVEDGKGHLVTAPATSPEHSFFTPDGQHSSVSIATTCDMAIIRDLFTHCIAASEILNQDAEFAAKLKTARARLYPAPIGADGAIQEWSQDWRSEDVHHRHVSHLFGLYPGSEINGAETPELFAAAKKALELRGDGGTGWSLAWKLNLWARLRDGEHAYIFVRNLLNPAEGGTNYNGGGAGVYRNLFDAHPPFQIDGNFGYTSGVAEMLLQSQNGTLYILPALPKAWATGHVAGLRARGGYAVDIAWENGTLREAVIHAAHNGTCRIRSTTPIEVRSGGAIAIKQMAPNLYEFTAHSGAVYHVGGVSK